MYRDGLAARMSDIGGLLYSFNSDGSRSLYKVENGVAGYWVTDSENYTSTNGTIPIHSTFYEVAGQGRGFGKPDMIFNGAPVFFSTVGDLKNGAAVTLPGIGIFINPKSRNDKDLLRHEFGHWLIALLEGKQIFYMLDAPLSLVSATFSSQHQNSWTEVRANDISYKYFDKPADWNFKDYHVSDGVRYNTPNFFQDIYNKAIQGVNQYNSGFSKW
jgi:hypothetical protein